MIYITGSSNTKITKSITFTDEIFNSFASANEGMLSIYKGNATFVAPNDAQIENGTTATTYVEHKEQTFTFPLGNEKLMLGDYLADDGIHHVRGQVVLNGNSNEVYGVGSEGDTTNGFTVFTGFNISNIKQGFDKIVLSNKFRFIEREQLTSTDINFITAGVSSIVVINIERSALSEASATGFKTWLQSNPVTVEYELAEETITPYTSAQQTVYNAIKEAISYEEQTNISGSSGGSNPIFDVEAYQSTKLVLQDFATAIVALGGV